MLYTDEAIKNRKLKANKIKRLEYEEKNLTIDKRK